MTKTKMGNDYPYQDYEPEFVRKQINEAEYQKVVARLFAIEVAQLVQAIQSKDYSHSRAGTYADGRLNNLVHIYHHDPKSPTGVSHAMTGDAAVVDYLIRVLRNNSPLSPTER